MAFTASVAGSKSDMNIVPLIDVLLVLLIIFMVTTPLLSHEIVIDLPQAPPDIVPPAPEPTPVRLRIDAGGALSWDGRALPAAALMPALQLEARRSPQPLIELEAANEASYQHLAEVLAQARNAGLQRIGFVEAD